MCKNKELITWLESNPELISKLKLMRELEERGESLDAVELELLELARGLASSSLERFVQSKNEEALSNERTKDGGRIHGKKN